MVIVPIVALICTGLVAGIFLGHRAGVSLAMPVLSPSSFVQLQQIIHRTFVRMMPVLNIGSVLSSVLWAVLQGVHGRTGEFWLVSGAAVLMICIFAMTLGINVPINKRLMTWNPAAPPHDLSTLWRPWERVHSVRTLLAIVAFAAEVIAVTSFRTPSPAFQAVNRLLRPLITCEKAIFRQL
jgi:uncharacterized membrane protein